MRKHETLCVVVVALLLLVGAVIMAGPVEAVYAQVEQPSYGEGAGLTGAQQLPQTGGSAVYVQVEQPSYGEGAGLTGAQQLPQTGAGAVYAQVEQPSYGEGSGLTGAQQLPQTGGASVAGASTAVVMSLGAAALLVGAAGVVRMRQR